MQKGSCSSTAITTMVIDVMLAADFIRPAAAFAVSEFWKVVARYTARGFVPDFDFNFDSNSA